MIYRLSANAHVEADSPKDAMRRMGEELLARAADEGEPWPTDGRVDISRPPLTFWVNVIPDKAD